MNLNEYQNFCNDCAEKVFNEELFSKIDYFNQQFSEIKLKDFSQIEVLLEEINKLIFVYFEQTNITIRKLIEEIRGKANYQYDKYESDSKLDPVHNIDNKVIIQSFKDTQNSIYNEYFISTKNFQEFNNSKQKYYQMKEFDRIRKITFNNKEFLALEVIEVLWSGWECDDKMWLIDENGIKKVITTNHGEFHEVSKEFLIQKISEYQKAMNDTQKFLNLLS